MYCPVCRAEYPADWKACPKDTTLLLKSAQIGKYTIEGLLGVGGMGAVYRAINPDTKGRVAVKVMNPAVAGAEQMRARFQREAAAVAALRTTHVVKVYDFGTEEDGTLYLVMELLDGHPLRDEIAAGPDFMDLARVHMVMDGALKGLTAAHRAGIVHRDLKPENIFVADTDDGEVPKLLDFGIARVRTRDSDLTRTGSLMGTASYMAPEQIAANFGEIGPWSDVYAMGGILYEMLAGSAAFGGDTITDVLQRVLRGDVVPLPTVRPGLPDAVYAFVARCMSTIPTERPRDAEDMRAGIAKLGLVPGGASAAMMAPPPHRARTADVAHANTNFAPGSASSAPLPLAPTHVTATAPPRRESPIEPAAHPRSKRPLVMLAVGALVAGGVGSFVALRDDPAPAVVAAADAAITSPVDAGTVAELPVDAAAPVPDPHAGMAKIAAGTYVIGAPKQKIPDALPKTTVVLGDLWIDRGELTVGALRAALGDRLPAEIADKIAADAETTPARFVDHATASAACAALGKRLPTEAEWEIAARSTPQDSKRARLNRTNTEADLVASATDCSPDELCDMLGGLLEWTADPWPKAKAGERVVRGASYRTKADGYLDTIHARHMILPATRDNEIGLRCASGPGAAEVTTATRPPTPVAPPPPKPPAPPPADDEGPCGELTAMRERAKQRLASGLHAAALKLATRAIDRCGDKDPSTASVAVMAACTLGRPAIARRFAAMVPANKQTALRAQCARHGVTL